MSNTPQPTSLFILPASSGRKTRCSPRKAAPARCQGACPDHTNPRNYLTKGGVRALEHKVEQMNLAAAQDLRLANEALANELVRAKSSHEQELEPLKAQVSRLELELRTDKERMSALRERLNHEVRLRQDMEYQQQHRMKEIQKRFKGEHEGRTAAETELAGLREQRQGLEQQISALESERQRLSDQLCEARSNAGRLEASASASAASMSELRSRLEAAEGRLESEQAARLDATGRLMGLEVQLCNSKDKVAELTTSAAEAESKRGALAARVQLLEDERVAAQQALAQEREAAATARQEAGKLQKELTDLQATSTIAATQATSDRAELERVKRELSSALVREEQAVEDVASQREVALHLRAELAGLQAAHESSMQAEAALREELRTVCEEHHTKLEAQKQAAKHEAEVKHAEFERHIDSTEADLHDCRSQLEAARAESSRLLQEVQKLSFQADNFARVFAENDGLTQQLAQTEASLRQKEAVLAEALSSHSSQLEMWRLEATEVAQAASKWKQRSLLLQAQLDARDRDLAALTEEAGRLGGTASTAQLERERLQAALAAAESKAASTQAEVQALWSQMQGALSAQQLSARKADSCQQELAQREAQADRLALRLQEESARVGQLRNQVAELTSQHVKELDGKSRLVADLTLSLQREERARAAAHEEAAALRHHLQAVERELRVAQASLSQISDLQLRGSEAFGNASAALLHADQRARHFNEETKRLAQQDRVAARLRAQADVARDERKQQPQQQQERQREPTAEDTQRRDLPAEVARSLGAGHGDSLGGANYGPVDDQSTAGFYRGQGLLRAPVSPTSSPESTGEATLERLERLLRANLI